MTRGRSAARSRERSGVGPSTCFEMARARSARRRALLRGRGRSGSRWQTHPTRARVGRRRTEISGITRVDDRDGSFLRFRAENAVWKFSPIWPTPSATGVETKKNPEFRPTILSSPSRHLKSERSDGDPRPIKRPERRHAKKRRMALAARGALPRHISTRVYASAHTHPNVKMACMSLSMKVAVAASECPRARSSHSATARVESRVASNERLWRSPRESLARRAGESDASERSEREIRRLTSLRVAPPPLSPAEPAAKKVQARKTGASSSLDFATDRARAIPDREGPTTGETRLASARRPRRRTSRGVVRAARPAERSRAVASAARRPRPAALPPSRARTTRCHEQQTLVSRPRRRCERTHADAFFPPLVFAPPRRLARQSPSPWSPRCPRCPRRPCSPPP